MPIKINGSTSGSTTITAPATGTDETIELSTALAAKAAISQLKILQVVEGSYSTETTIASTTYTDTGLTATITPASTSNKILIFVNQLGFITRGTSDASAYLKLLRGSTSLVDTVGMYLDAGNSGYGTNGFMTYMNLIYLDSPSSTAATTYKTQARVGTTANSCSIRTSYNGSRSSLLLMEVKA